MPNDSRYNTAMRFISLLLCTAAFVAVTGCASTTVVIAPSPQPPICDGGAAALILWAPQWRSDQKDVAHRESVAATGLQAFLDGSACFAKWALHRTSDLNPASIQAQLASAGGRFDKVVVISVRELGPIVKLLSSAALVDGGTQVLLQVEEYPLPAAELRRAFTVNWHNGGPGVVKGIASLSQDMQAALVAGLQPGIPAR